MTNNLSYYKLYTFGGGEQTVPSKTKDEVIKEILDSPAVALRGHRDELIIYVEEDGEAPLQWRPEVKGLLETFDEAEVRALNRLIKNRIEVQSKSF